MYTQVPKDIVAFIKKMGDPAMTGEARKLLVKLLEVETTPQADPAVMQRNEQGVFEVIRREIEEIYGKRRKPQFVPITPKIAEHRFYTPPHYTKTAERPQGLTVDETYKGRGNLLFTLKARAGKGMALAMNSHIDTVAPYFPPSVKRDKVIGRGACDAKGQIVVMLTQMRMLCETMKKFGLSLKNSLQYQFVTEEEPGGNGSLSLAVQDLFKFDVMVVHEITELKIHPGNRGAVWYKIELDVLGHPALKPLEMAACTVLALEKEGAKIKEESEHPLFPTRPVQTSHGIIGPFGEHPSAVNDCVVFHVLGEIDGPALRKIIRDAIEDYRSMYGDKTKEKDDATGKPVVAKHFTISKIKGGVEVSIFGKAGHMGALLECDNAITKASYVIRALLDYRLKSDTAVTLELHGHSGDRLVLEGGQGFLPTHEMEEITKRISDAAINGVAAYCALAGVPMREEMVRTTFEKLHNAAFARNTNTPAVKAATYAAELVGIPTEDPMTGWNVSCDARLFANAFPTREIITFGVGSLSSAHSAHEYVSMKEIMTAARMMTVYALAVCGF